MEDLRPTPDADPDEIRRAWRIFVDEGAVIELRALKTRQNIVSGYYTDPEAFVRDATALSGQAAGVYFTLNPVKKALFARAANRAKGWARATTSDQDVTERRWFGIDFDARREAEISATDEEHAAALEKTRAARAWLSSLGWPASVLADSGNGGHAVYSIRLPNDPETTALLERCLKVLAARFDDEQVQVDQRTFNAARIWKLYGTAACKGDSIPDRPHRLACGLIVPDAVIDLTRDQLEALAEMSPEDTPAGRGHATFSTGGRPFDLEDWIARYAPDVVKHPGAWGSGERWEFPVCPWNEAHTNGAAFLIRRVNGAIAAGCLHNGCKGKRWHDLRDAREPGWRERREAWEARQTEISSNGSHSEYFGGLRENSEYPISSTKSNSGDYGKHEGGLWPPLLEIEPSDPPPFPVGALPGWLGEYIEAEAVATQTPVDLGAMLALSVLSAACAKKVIVRVRRGWEEPVNIFILVGAEAATRKTAVLNDLQKPIVQFECEEGMERAQEVFARESERRILEGRIKALEARAVREDDPALRDEALAAGRELANLESLHDLRLVTDDTTPEMLALLLSEQKGRMAILSDEGGIFNIMAGRYSQNGSPNIEVFLKGHAGSMLRVDRIGRKAARVKAPALTIGAAVQPDVIQELCQNRTFLRRGLLGRFLYSMPRDLLGGRVSLPTPTPEAVEREYFDRVMGLLALPLPDDGHEFRLFLTDEAQTLVVAFQDWMEPLLGEGGYFREMSHWSGKLVGGTCRMAALLHMAIHAGDPAPWQYPIEQSTLERAIAIGHYAANHARIVFLEMATNPTTERGCAIVRWLRREKRATFSKRDVWNGLRGRFERAGDIDPVLDLLVSTGYIRQLPPEERDGPGRPPGRTFEVRPAGVPPEGGKAPDLADPPSTLPKIPAIRD